MVARLSPCYILIHQEALLDVIHVLVALLKDTGLLDPEPPATSPPARSRVSKSTRRPSKGKSVLIAPFIVRQDS